jgi:hypothetical protein
VLLSDRGLDKARHVKTDRSQLFVPPPIEATQFRAVYASVHGLLRKMGHPPFVPVIARLRVASANKQLRFFCQGIAQLCEEKPFEVERGDAVTLQLWCMPRSEAAAPPCLAYTCSENVGTFPLV